MIKQVLVALTLLSAGCAVEAPAASFPYPASLSASTRRTGAWQQFCEQATTVPQASSLVAARGADGWELVGMSGGVLCYKRPTGDPFLAPVTSSPMAGTMSAPILRAPSYPLSTTRDPGF